MSEYSIIGKSVPRTDAIPKVTGAAQYAGDVVLPRMLYGKILRSPHPHARILKIDTSKAEKLLGVKAIITGKRDTEGVRYGLFPGTRDEYALAIDKVRYIGDEVAAVAAVDEDTADDALNLIEVEYEVLPAIYDPLEAMKQGAPQLHDHKPRNKTVVIDTEYGDVAKGFKESDHIRQDRFTTVELTHCIPERYGALATCDSSGYIDVWVNNQSPFIKQKALSTTMKIPEHKIRFHRPYLGGAFGSQSEMLKAEFLAAALARKVQRPVRIWLSREETTTCTRQKHPFYMDLKTGVKRDGTLMAVWLRNIADGGAYISTGAIAMMCPIVSTLALYRYPNFKYTVDRVCTNNPPHGAMRGHGNQQVFFAQESQFDMIAEDLGMDPVAFRLKNAARTGDVAVNKSKLFSVGLVETIEKSAKASGWSKKHGKLPPYKGIGIGCGTYFHGFDYGYRTLSSAIVKFNEEGEVAIFSGNIDNGQGNETLLTQVVSEELGIPMKDIRLVNGDTLMCPTDPGTHTMSTTLVTANAAKSAAVDARQQLFEIAAEALEANPGDLESKEGTIYVKGSPAQGISFRHAVRAGLTKGRAVIGKANYAPPCDPLNWYEGKIDGQTAGAYSYGTTVAEVEIDRDTGEVKVPKVTVAHDCGFAINPMVVEGSMQGSLLFGLGQALYEEVRVDNGQVMNPTYLDYTLPTSLQMPEIKTIIVESNDPIGPYNAKGLDTPCMAISQAIGNAIYDAIGVRIMELPITPEKILKALEEKNGGGKSLGMKIDRVLMKLPGSHSNKNVDRTSQF